MPSEEPTTPPSEKEMVDASAVAPLPSVVVAPIGNPVSVSGPPVVITDVEAEDMATSEDTSAPPPAGY